ncbi:hypothetical protein BDA99DRAFT_522393 [Phascolomyces articulosus]|uniref:Myb-like, SWIRM and MPN domain-containing protein 1 n=1 Tax=Phascolomyces articulosus TaxID=60185 RepID=A0AAD5K1T9_9FUNG|nr:hypothetical protein BDA99DRAFT_522393 [Phascolomyces articulosus]
MDDEIIDIDDENSEQSSTIAPESSTLPESTPISHNDTTVTTIPEYESIPWTNNHDPDMDDESRALIEQMLAEEQYYYGTDTIATLPTTKTTANKRKAKKPSTTNATKKLKTEPTISSASLPSHKTRWTSTEDDLLRSAIDQYGYGNWKAIAAQVKTRNSLQCKNRARHWVLSDKLEKQVGSPSTTESSQQEHQHATIKEEPKEEETKVEKDEEKKGLDTVKNNEPLDDDDDKDEEEDEEISVEDSGSPPRPLSMEVPIIHPDGDDETEQLRLKNGEDEEDQKRLLENDKKAQEMVPLEQDDISVAQQTSEALKTKDEIQHTKPNNEIVEKEENVTQVNHPAIQVDHPAIQGPALPDPQIQSSSTPISNPPSPSPLSATKPSSLSTVPVSTDLLTTVEKATTTEPEPSDATSALFDKHSISEEEKQSNPEWFCNKHSKTPDRYLKIRNHILDCWRECRPRYLTKTSARKGLANCGDVNAIGRVHTYLESVGAINVGCINNAPRQHPPKRPRAESSSLVHDENSATNDDMFAAADLVIGYDGPRKRKVRNELGEWVDPKELEGRVIEHGQEIKPSRPKRVIKRPHHHFDGAGYDPFRLVPLAHYDDEYVAPFIVDITSDALLIMDFHSHLAHTEIIGLLGGKFEDHYGNSNSGQSSASPSQKILKVQSVFPCKSTSTGIQCEMDPASEMKAREVFAEKGYSVVGWYHSHPTFEPHPSIRDIENQTSYQTLFRDENSGDEPFIGVIVTPYDTDTVSDHSLIQYIHISPRWNESNPFRVPYACKRMVHQSEQVSPQVFEEFEKLVHEFKDYEHKVNMLHAFSGSRTRLDKLLDSIRANLFLPAEKVTEYLERVKQLMLTHFISHTIESSSLSPHNGSENDEDDAANTTTTTTTTMDAAAPSKSNSSTNPSPSPSSSSSSSINNMNHEEGDTLFNNNNNNININNSDTNNKENHT